MIEVQQVTKFFGPKKAVNNVSFSVAEGETLILLGTSGCGKTTTLRMMNRLLEPASGSIRVNGRAVTEIAPEVLRRNMGYVLQHTGLFPHFTVAENMAVVPKLLKWTPEQIQVRMAELITKLNLTEDYLTLYPHQLSGGQQQRVGLARALMADPPILLMDEPFGALDPITRANIRQEFISLDELKRKTIVMVTHDVTEAFALGDRICLMNKGQLEQIGSPEELLFQPQTDFVKSFLSDQRLALELKALKISGTSLSDNDHSSTDVSLWDSLSGLIEQNQLPINPESTGNSSRSSYSVKLTSLISALQNLGKS